MTRTFTNAFALVVAMLVTTALMTPTINVPADYVTLTAEIA